MRLIIAGGRDIKVSSWQIEKLLKSFNLDPTEIVCGMASGVDSAGLLYAEAVGIRVKKFPAMWNDLSTAPVLKRVRKDGTTYNALAGHQRNQKMANYADALLLIWNGESKGSADMLARARAKNLVIYEVLV